MAISNEIRRAGPYAGDGSQKVFTFGFKVFEADDIAVYESDTEGNDSLIDSALYSVSLNENQDNSPGGTVTLIDPLASGTNLSIISEMDYTQPMVLTNRGGFYPETLNNSADRSTIQIQQLKEKIDRALTVPVTSNETPELLTERLLAAQQEAQQYANQAEAAKKAAEDARDEILGEQSTVISAIEDKGEEVTADIVAAGDAQVERLEAATDETLVGYGVAGHQETWTLTADVAANNEITLPNGMTYIVGRDHLRISWNGLILAIDENFEEVGTEDAASTKFKTLFGMKTGDVLNAWTVPLGRGELGNVEQEVNALTESVAELSRKAAFHNVGEQQQ